jgi:O-antigen ligase
MLRTIPIQLRTTRSTLGLVGLSILAALVVSATISGEADAYLGSRFSLVLLGTVLVTISIVIFADLPPAAIVISWAPLAAALWAFARLPKNPPVLTFDRLWILGMLGYLIFWPRRFERSRESRLLMLALLVLLVSYGIHVFAGGASVTTPAFADWFDAIVLPAILFATVSRFCDTRARAQAIMGSLAIAGGVLGAIGVAERIFGFNLSSLNGVKARFDTSLLQVRISGPYQVPEPYALSLVICLAATLYWIQTRRPRPYALGALLVSLEAAGIAVTLFRAAWLSGLVVVIASIGLRPGRFGRAALTLGAVLVLVAAANTSLAQNQTYTARLKERDNIWGRLATYEQGLEIFRGSPLFGVGVDNYTVASQERAPVFVHNVQSIDFPHNSYVAVLAEQGLVGFVPLLLLTFAVWRLIRGLRRRTASEDLRVLVGVLSGAALGYLLMSLTLQMLTFSPSNLFFAALLGVGAGRLDSQRTVEPPAEESFPAE